MAGEAETMEQSIVYALQDAVLNVSFVQRSLDTYVRTLLGIGADDDVTDNGQYWDEYARKLQYYVIKMVPELRREYTHEEIVF